MKGDKGHNSRSLITRSLLNIGLAAALVVLIVIGWLTYLHFVRFTETTRSVMHTYAVELELMDLLSSLKDAETGQRGFIITGNRAYLEPYTQALDEIEGSMVRLRALAQGSRRLQQELSEIESLIEARLQFVDETVEVRSAQGFEAAQAMIQTDRGKQLMDELRRRTAQIRQQETATLEEQIAATQTTTERLMRLLLIGGILSWIVLLAAILIFSREIRNRRRAQDESLRNEQQFRALFDLAGGGNAVVDAETGKYLRVNSKFCEITGYSADDLKGLRITEITHPDDRPQESAAFEKIRQTGTPQVLDKRCIRKDGDVRWLYMVESIVRGKEGRPGEIIQSTFDITDRKAWEAELHRLNRTLRAISDSSQAMMYAKDEMSYLQQVCDIIVRDCGHTLVWIGYAEDDPQKTIRPAAYSGFEVAYLETLQMTWADTEEGQNPIAEAIRTAKPVMCKNLSRDPCFGPWRNQALKRGYASAIALPITAQNRTFGVLTIYSRQSDPFPPDEVKLIKELTVDLAFGITGLRLRAEQEKAQAVQKYFRALFESAPGLYLVLEPEDFRIAAVSDAYLRATMTERESIMGKGLFEVFPDDPDNPRADGVRNLRASLEHVKKSGRADMMAVQRYPIRRPDGSWEERWWSPINSPVFGPDERLAYIIHRVEDVTSFIHHLERQGQQVEAWKYLETRQQHMEAEVVMRSQELQRINKQLRESEETFRLLAENARAIIGIVQGDRFIYVNPYLEELSGYTREELLQMPVAQLIHPESRALVLERARRRQAGEELESHYEFAALTKSGQKRILDISINRIHYRGQPALVGIAIDVTDRKYIEQDLHNYKIRLESKNKELETIISIVSHDLRAPLFNINGFSGEIKKDCRVLEELFLKAAMEPASRQKADEMLRERIPESLEYIGVSAEAMNNLVSALVEVARAGFVPIRPQTLDMNQLMERILASIEMKVKQAGAAYSIDDMPGCFADQNQVEQIFRNLLDNAVKYLDPDRPGQICIGGKPEANTSLYWIADNGIGISPEDQAKIFEPYYQLKEKASGGMGMGLATVKRMVEHNNGKVWVVSEKGKGSTFYVALPANQPR